MLLNCGVSTLESPLDCKEIKPVHPKGNQSWIFIGRTDTEAETPNLLATWCKELTHCKRPWYWERLKAGGEADKWDGWMSSPTRWAWVWASSGSWWQQGNLACCSPWGHRESDMTEWQLNWTQFLSAIYWIGLLFLLTYTDALVCWVSTQWIFVEWMNKYIRVYF